MAQKTEPRAPRAPRRRTSAVTYVLLALTALGMLVFIGSVGLTWYLFTLGSRAMVTDESWLHVKLEGIVPDAPVQGGLLMQPDEAPPLISEISAALRKAGTDDRIEGVLLRLDNPMLGWAGAQEIRDALFDLREEGKPCVVYSEMYTSGTYYLASACDKVVLAPSGLSMVSGLALSVTYYRDAFDHLGIEPEFVHAGEFKSGVEPYVRNGPSPAAEEAYNDLADQVYEQMVAGIAEGRDMPAEQVRTYIDGMRLNPEVALERGLVDALAFPDAVGKSLGRVGEEDWHEEVGRLHEEWDDDRLRDRFTSLREYVKEIRAANQRRGDRIAVIHADGPIQSGDAQPSLFGGAVLTDGAFRQWMREARTDDRVKAVVVRVNSPGGSGLASDMMWHEVERTKAEGKPVVVSMGDYAASGGYFISANADWIVTQPATLTGSIGVLGGKFNVEGTFDKIGVSQTRYKRGELSDLLSLTTPFSEEGREAFRDYLDGFYELFVQKVADGRGMSYEEAEAVSGGRVWTGTQAVDNGLADELGGLDQAIAKAAELAEVDTWSLRRLPEQKGLFELLLADLSRSSAAPRVEVSFLPEIPGTQAAVEELVLLSEMLADGGALTYLPGQPRFE